MTPSEILAELRDIHHPPDAAVSPVDPIAIWPIALFLLIVTIGFFVHWRRSNRWRREAMAALLSLDQLDEPADRFAAMQTLGLRLRRLMPGAKPLPTITHRPPTQVGAVELAALRLDLEDRIG